MKWVERWRVRSHSSNRRYTVSLAEDGETWGCSCPHWINNYPRPLCKHIQEVQASEGNTSTVEKDEFFTEEEFAL